jgi:DNA-binding NarL/FixJ family response regulator
MRVFLIDAHPVFREGLKSIMTAITDLTLMGEAATCRDMPQAARNADLLILDGEMDSLILLNTMEKFRSKGRPPYVLVLTRHDEERHAIQMLAAGADGYLTKLSSPETILEAIRKIARGGKYVSKDVAETVIFTTNRMLGPSRLSDREYQVLYMFASGMGMKEIAAHLSLSVKTVSTYRSRLLEKLHLKSNAQLMRYAFTEGVIA